MFSMAEVPFDFTKLMSGTLAGRNLAVEVREELEEKSQEASQGTLLPDPSPSPRQFSACQVGCQEDVQL